jgi:Fe-S cluster biogenesis protein NfuA
MTSIPNSDFQAHAERIDQMVRRISSLTDEGARTAALELLQSMMDLHGAVISRVVQLLDTGEAGRASLAKLGNDPLVCGMFVLYGVHPVPLEERIARAIESARPQLRKHGGNVQLIGVSDGIVRLKVESSGHGCGSSADALKGTLEQAILEAAPEVLEVHVEGAPVAAGFVPLSLIQPATREEKDYEESAA